MKAILTVAFVALFSTSAFARPVAPVLPAGQVYAVHPHRLAVPHVALTARAQAGLERRQLAQREQIARGLREGLLTPREAKKLTKEQRKIEKATHRALGDGVLLVSEVRKLDRLLDRAEARIEALTYNAEVRGARAARVMVPSRPAPVVVVRAPHPVTRTYRPVRLARSF